MTLVGHKTGEENMRQAISVGFTCMKYALIICSVFAVLFIAIPKEILSLFTNDNTLIEYAAPFFMIVSLTMFPKSINNIIGLGIQGMGDTKWMFYGQIFGTVLVVSLSYVLIFVAKLGMIGIFITFFIDETIRSIINLLRFWKGREFFRLHPFEKVVEKAGTEKI